MDDRQQLLDRLGADLVAVEAQKKDAGGYAGQLVLGLLMAAVIGVFHHWWFNTAPHYIAAQFGDVFLFGVLVGVLYAAALLFAAAWVLLTIGLIVRKAIR